MASSTAAPDSLASIIKGSRVVFQLEPIDTMVPLPNEAEETIGEPDVPLPKTAE
jgi:hypothetical protein